MQLGYGGGGGALPAHIDGRGECQRIEGCAGQAAVPRLPNHQLASTGHAEGYLLCYFHFLQDWERFLSSGDAGVPKAERHRIMLALARLAHMQDQAPFQQEVGSNAAHGQQSTGAHPLATCMRHCPAPPQLACFILSNSQQHPPVAQRMQNSWVPCAEKWAWCGRLDVLDLQCNTSNLGERNFGLIKYTDLERRAQLTLHELLLQLLTKTVPRNIQNRAHMLAGRVTSDQQQREQRAALWVQKLVERGAVVPAADSSTPELTLMQQGEDAPPVHSCVGDLSCSCGYSGEWKEPGSGQCIAMSAVRCLPTSPHRLPMAAQRSMCASTCGQPLRSSATHTSCGWRRQRTWWRLG